MKAAAERHYLGFKERGHAHHYLHGIDSIDQPSVAGLAEVNGNDGRIIQNRSLVAFRDIAQDLVPPRDSTAAPTRQAASSASRVIPDIPAGPFGRLLPVVIPAAKLPTSFASLSTSALPLNSRMQLGRFSRSTDQEEWAAVRI